MLMGKLGYRRSRREPPHRRERGAALVELAFVMPLLVLLLLGMAEIGWGLAQQIDVRHKAREVLRLVIVDSPVDEIVARACDDDIVAGSDIREIILETDLEPGSNATVTVTAGLRQITGLFGSFWGPDPTISSTVEGRVEQETTTFKPPADLVPCP